MNFVTPSTYLVAVTGFAEGIEDYLRDSGNEEFIDSIDAARYGGLSDGEILCSFYAKLCYKSLTLGKNANISRTRDIESNLASCLDSGHGSVFEHCWLNFVTTNCSRVFTHELVRHRVGTAFSQTSGRYVALENIDFIMDPILESVADDIREVVEFVERKASEMRDKLGVEGESFAVKKKLTSAIRRIAPNGQANEIGWSANIRSLRHMIQMRTHTSAEWEIRVIFNQVADIIQERYSGILYGVDIMDTKDGLRQYGNLRV